MTTAPDVLLATCAALPDGDEDGAVLLAALAGAGVDARWVGWGDPGVDWSAPVVLRTTWDYTLRSAEFLGWLDSLRTVHNPAAVVRWNSDKTYLLDLAADGVPVTATTAFRPGEPVLLPAEGELVIKPSVGAGSRGAGRFTADRRDAAREHAGALHAAGRTALVQPYLEQVADAGETALLFFGGEFSHAIRKGPMLGSGPAYPLDERAGLYIEENISHREASAAERAVGAAALASVAARFGELPLYARIDLLPSVDGPVVVEVELTEPSLFLQYDGTGEPARRFARAVAARLTGR